VAIQEGTTERRRGPPDPVRSRESASTGSAETEAGAPRERTDLFALCRSWRAALNALDAGLDAAARALPARELSGRRGRLASDRAAALRLIKRIAQDEGIDGRFLHLSSEAGIRVLLGLRGDAAACVFDLDGVLIASDALHVAAWANAFDELTLERTERTVGHVRPFNPRTDYAQHLRARPRLEGVRSFLASRGISLLDGDPDDPSGAETVNGLANRKQQALVRLIRERGVTAFTGSLTYLDFAQEVGVRTAVVSASANTRALLDRAGFGNRIEVCIDGNAIEAGRLRLKPAPDTLLAACGALGVEPRQAAAFETRTAGVTAARAAGLARVLGVGEGGVADALLASGADAVVPGLAGVLDRTLDLPA
jgi:beta-phosphoglucomutase-like phosphatase (HAD superfamily)